MRNETTSQNIHPTYNKFNIYLLMYINNKSFLKIAVIIKY